MSRHFAALPVRLALGTALLLSGGLSARAADAPPADPVLATVNGQPIHLSEVQEAAKSLPQAHGMPPAKLYPLLVDQLVDAKALLAAAEKAGMDKDPAVRNAMQAAAEHALESAYLSKTVLAQVTDDAVRKKYDEEFAGKKGEPEVHARHILVADEATAKKIIAELKKGADFAKLSAQYSKDPGSAKQGGDLGFFKKSEMVPEFANAAFALKDNEISPQPVKTEFGYHVIQVLGHRTAPVPTFEQERDSLRQKMIQAAVQKQIAAAKANAKIERFNLDGSTPKATDTAVPPPAK